MSEKFEALVINQDGDNFTREVKSAEVGDDLIEDTADNSVEVSSVMDSYLQALKKSS